MLQHADMKNNEMTINEVCSRLEIHRETLRRWTKSGLLSTRKVGPLRVIYDRKEVEKLAKGVAV